MDSEMPSTRPVRLHYQDRSDNILEKKHSHDMPAKLSKDIPFCMGNPRERNIMKRITVSLAIGIAAFFSCGGNAAETDKTLVVWVAPANLTHRGGSALTIQSGDQFDGIVFGELQPGKWMAGSDFHKRTEKAQDKYIPETTDSKTMVQMAIVYKDDRILIYRNGESYATYRTKNIDLLSPENNIAVFGLRHVGAGGGRISGTIEDARIYSKALTLDEIKSLEANKRSEIEPYAWWDFEGDKVEDRTGRFAHSRMKNGAKLADGKLVLSEYSILVAAATEDDAKMATRAQGAHAPAAPYVEETPAMPKDVPANWLTYHLAHPGPGVGMPGDPNPAFYYKGRYHLHYIYKNKHGFAFAHVSSKDMVTWKWHPTVLVGPNTGHGMFSGTGFFTKAGRPAMIYHGQGSGNNYLAFALDDNLDEWTKPVAVKPKTKSGQSAEIRMWDPDCWLNGDTYYAISGGGPPHLMKSSNLEEWEYLGLLLHEDMPDLGVNKNEDVSCANMFKIGDKWMLLCISHEMGCRYYLGNFKDEKYLPEFHAMMNWKDWNFFAPESLLTPDGRRVMWAWCNMEGAQSAIQSLPRELNLPEDGVLRIKPLRELKKLRYDQKNEGNITVKSDSSHMLKDIYGDTVELSVAIKPTSAKEYGVSVFCDKDGKGFPVTIKPESKVLAMGEIKPPFELKKGEDLNLRIFLDKGMVEVFVNDRQAAVYMHQHDKGNVGISLFSKGGDITAKVKSWKMKSIYAGQ
jgi:sucrose-6-phosphate hydrolase SacC (GH32 family)